MGQWYISLPYERQLRGAGHDHNHNNRPANFQFKSFFFRNKSSRSILPSD